MKISNNENARENTKEFIKNSNMVFGTEEKILLEKIATYLKTKITELDGLIISAKPYIFNNAFCNLDYKICLNNLDDQKKNLFIENIKQFLTNSEMENIQLDYAFNHYVYLSFVLC